jgi:hypothetical protein
MNRSILKVVISSAFLATAQASFAGEVTGLTNFSAGTPARAAEVNGNFTAVKTAVDNNHARVTTLEGVNAAARLSTLETNAASPDITGNITLVPSTATVGNILKSSARFIHNFGIGNTFLGVNAGNFIMTGDSNTAAGFEALHDNTTGAQNTASGFRALQNNMTGFSNTANGLQALRENTTGSGNTASGANALFLNETGINNTASGLQALQDNTTGSGNTASGVRALQNNTTGSGNTAIGGGAGLNLTTGSNNIAIDNVGIADESNTIRIGDTQTRTFIAGIRGVTTATAAIPVLVGTDGQLGTVSSSRRVKDDITDMGTASTVLMQLRPVTFHYKSDQNPKGRSLQYGLVAEEVAAVAPNLVARSASGEIETVYYQHLTPMLLNEYQKQQRIIEAQAALLAKQTARVAALEQQAARMTAAFSRLEQSGKVARAGR